MEIAKKVLLQWPGAEAPFDLRRIPGRVLLANPLCDRFHISLSLLKPNARFQASDHVESFPLALIRPDHFGRRRARHNDFNLLGAKISEARWHDADHGVTFVIQGDALAEDLRITAEASLPQTIIHNHYSVIARIIILRQEDAA